MTPIKPEIQEKALQILEAIKSSNSVLLHCHPSPDPDCVGSALAMKHVVEQLGKKVTVIKGDSEIPQAFMHFPGATDILMKSYWEINQDDYDLFIIVDSGLSGVSRNPVPTDRPKMKIVNIDHHRTNKGDGDINIVDPSYPAVAELIYDILTCMEITITEVIAINLFMGIFSDTGGFKYSGISPRTFQTAGDLISIYPEMDKVVAKMENSKTLHDLDFLGLAISSTEEILDGKAFVSVLPNSKIVEKKIPAICISAGVVSSMLRTVGGYLFSCAMVEAEPNQIRMSFRSSDGAKYDVSKLAAIFGGGGHKAAAGAVLNMSIEEAKSLVETKAKELYNL